MSEQNSLHPDLGLLAESLQTPVWIFDIEHCRMLWANRAALRLWSAAELASLRGRDFDAEMSDTVRLRLRSYLSRFRRGEQVTETWTFYPEGVPTTVVCRCSGYRLSDDTIAMLVEGAAQVDAPDGPMLRAVEVLRHTPVMISVFDEEGLALVRNPSAEAAFQGIDRIQDQFPDRRGWAMVQAVLDRQPEAYLDELVGTADGLRWHHVALRRCRDPLGGGMLTVASEVDIHARKRAEDALASSRGRLQTLVENVDVGVLFEDEWRRVVEVNSRFCELLGLGVTAASLLGRYGPDGYGEAASAFRDSDVFLEGMERAAAGHPPAAAEELQLWDGRVLERRYVPVAVDGAHCGHLWQLQDITERKRKEGRLRSLAATDSLTGLPNRRHVLAEARRVFHSSRSLGMALSVLMVDVDHFKRINDTLGHGAGDCALRALAELIRSTLRPGDLAGRLGGEEFLVLVTGATDAGAVAERLRAVAGERCWAAPGLRCTLSIGLATALPEDAEFETLLARADRALYEAKGAGRDQVVAL